MAMGKMLVLALKLIHFRTSRLLSVLPASSTEGSHAVSYLSLPCVWCSRATHTHTHTHTPTHARTPSLCDAGKRGMESKVHPAQTHTHRNTHRHTHTHACMHTQPRPDSCILREKASKHPERLEVKRERCLDISPDMQ